MLEQRIDLDVGERQVFKSLIDLDLVEANGIGATAAEYLRRARLLFAIVNAHPDDDPARREGILDAILEGSESRAGYADSNQASDCSDHNRRDERNGDAAPICHRDSSAGECTNQEEKLEDCDRHQSGIVSAYKGAARGAGDVPKFFGRHRRQPPSSSYDIDVGQDINVGAIKAFRQQLVDRQFKGAPRAEDAHGFADEG